MSLALHYHPLTTALDMAEAHAAGKHWTTGEDVTLADCAAAPALIDADKAEPFAGRWPNATALLERLTARPSFARALGAAEPYFQYFPEE